MKQRVISIIFMSIIVIPLFVIGGMPYNIGIAILSLLGLKEFLDIKESKKKLPLFVKVISYVFLLLVLFTNKGNSIRSFAIDFRIISGLFFTFLIPTVLYHDREKYSVNDAMFMLGGIFFLSMSMALFMRMRTYDYKTMIYLILVAVITDTFAYITGKLIGKHKLLENISPNKTVEGTIGGSIFGVFVPCMYYITVIHPEVSIIKLVLMTGFLSILGQFGDLFFSAIKRYYGKKDFSNLIPGHGGVLDRVDSLIFILLGFMFLISVI